MTMDREKEREAELESAMYTNCLLLGLDPAVLNAGGNGSTPRVGQFRHSNPKMGEQLLYFILCSLRGPIQSAKDFDKVWPIFDSVQQRDFRKIVQGIITELESQGALPRSNSRVSSLATCCGPRFVELLWQLSLHALREVHRRSFAADVASNPLPASLTDVSYSHAAALLPVTKARIALERRKFLKNANIAVQRQATWSSLAHDITAEFRGLCAEEAYLQQELEKLQDLRNLVKLEGEPWDDRVSSSLGQNSHLVSKATRQWDSLLSRKNQHEVLASGPIEDLIAHREHRYRISGSALLASMNQSSQVPNLDMSSVPPGDRSSKQPDDRDMNLSKDKEKSSIDTIQLQGNDETIPRVDDRSGRVHPTVDIAEILRRWTHALQRIHKQSLHLAKANDGEGPDLLRCASDNGSSGHAESLAATLAEHRQHLASIQAFINQLKEVAPTIEETISELTEEVNRISPVVPIDKYDGRSTPPNQAQSSGRTLDMSNEVSDVTSKMSSIQLEKASTSPALKLPHLFSLTPNSSGRGSNVQKRHNIATNQVDNLPEVKSVTEPQPLSNGHGDNLTQDTEGSYVQSIRRSVREAALSVPSVNPDSLRETESEDSSRHFFVPVTTNNSFSPTGPATKSAIVKSKQRLSVTLPDGSQHSHNNNRTESLPPKSNASEGSDLLRQTKKVNGSLSPSPPYFISTSDTSFFDLEDTPEQVFSPQLLMESSMFEDSYEDLLAPLSEVDAALIDR
ncbi:AUGMIN subunit 6-like [Aristolochia californica]|uniref:AUGMIN subunit 6-like n=1 Tax=Aristolochia californica TaxID=171875 RepID=UPI0035DC11CA